MGCNTSKAATSAVVENKPTELKQNKPQPPPPPVSTDIIKKTEPIDLSLNAYDDSKKLTSEISMTPATYDLTAYFALPKIETLLKDNVATKEKLTELFEVLDDDKDGLLTEAEVDDIVYLVKSSREDETADATSEPIEEGPIMSEGVHIQLKPVGADEASHNAFPGTTPGGTRVGGPAGRRPPTKFLTPEAASPRKLIHPGTVNTAEDVLSPRTNIMSDFDDDAPTESINTPNHPSNVSAMSTSFNGSVDTDDSSAKKIKKRRSYVDERDFIGPTPPTKKGFLMTSPMKENLYHVLDSGILYCLDSNARSPKSFSLDSKGVNLLGRKLVVREDNVLELLPPDQSNGQAPTEEQSTEEEVFDMNRRVIEIKPRNERERQGWIKAFEDHIEFLKRQADYEQLQA